MVILFIFCYQSYAFDLEIVYEAKRMDYQSIGRMDGNLIMLCYQSYALGLEIVYGFIQYWKSGAYGW